MNKSKAATLGEQVHDEISETQHDCEDLLMLCAIEKRQPNYSELQFLTIKGGFDKQRIPGELGRCLRVLRHQQIAGDLQAREAMQVEVKKSADILASEGSKLTSQIETLQSKLFALERSAKLSEKRLGEMNDSVEQLRTEAPTFVRNEHAERSSFIGQGLGYECQAAESDVTYLTSMLALDISAPNAIDTIRVHFPLIVQIDAYHRHFINGQAWQAQCLEMTSQLKKLRPRAIELRLEYDLARSVIDELLDFYV